MLSSKDTLYKMRTTSSVLLCLFIILGTLDILSMIQVIQKSWALGCCSVVKHFLGIKAISSRTTKKRKVAVKISHLFLRTFQNKD